MSKQRMTITVDREAAAAALRAVEEGKAESVSSWVNQALIEKATRERRLQALDAAIGEFEKAHGEFTTEELVSLQRRDAERASVVRGSPEPPIKSAKQGKRTGAA